MARWAGGQMMGSPLWPVAPLCCLARRFAETMVEVYRFIYFSLIYLHLFIKVECDKIFAKAEISPSE